MLHILHFGVVFLKSGKGVLLTSIHRPLCN